MSELNRNLCLEANNSLIIKGNEPQLLDDLEIWVIESGALALFTVTLEEDIPTGDRHYLLSIGPQEALFGIAPLAEKQLGVLAVAIEETQIRTIPREHFFKLVTEANAEAVTLIESWLQQLGCGLYEALAAADVGKSGLSVRTIGFDSLIRSSEGMNQALPLMPMLKGEVQEDDRSQPICISVAEERIAPAKDTVSWVKLRKGQAHLMGYEELTLSPKSGFLPLSDSMWLEAVGTIELDIVNTASISDSNLLLEGIAQLHKLSLRLLNLLEQQEAIAEQQRFQERERLNRQVTVEALEEIASVLQPKPADFLTEGTDLLIAAGAVGRALGITIYPPAKSEDLSRVKNPLEAIARASHFRMRRVLLSSNWWQKDCGPLLGYIGEDNQPVGLLPTSGGQFEIFDPRAGTRALVDARSADNLASFAYMFYRPLPDKNLKAWDLIRFALSGRNKDLIAILLTGLASSLLGLLVPQATAILINTAIPEANQGLVWQIGLGLLAVAIGAAIFRLVQGFATLRLQSFSDATTQAAVWDRLLKLRVSFFHKYSTGDLKFRVTAISQIRSKLSGHILQTLFASFFSLLTLGLLFYYSTQLAFLALFVALITAIVTTISGILLLRQFRPLLELQGEIVGLMVQLINGVSKLQVAAAEERAFAAWARKYSQQLRLTLSSQLIEDSIRVFNTVMPTVTAILIFWFAWHLVGQPQGTAHLSAGTFLAFYIAFGIFINGATSLSNTVTEVLEIITLWKRAKPILVAEPEIDSSKTDPGRLSGGLSLEHVTFRYRQDGPLNLDDVCIAAEPGEFIALVGPSGSGKSTILRLLLGFETPEAGAVKYDGQDLSGLDISAIRRQLGVVLQNARINTASIFDNISSGALVTLDEAWEAARLAGFADDVSAMPMQMHTVISEGGTNLSGGQRQRLLIARALVLQPRILLFDEATSALDNRTQAIVSASLEQLQVTRVVVAHRLSTIRHAERIYAIQDGRVVQQGNFETLINQEGLFAQLMARQMT
ncbi:MAG: NHLP bacteriocin export ABC transporter permease/ATPase subunit [Chroococcidiopsidaceae cyanobacterium CP_BM_ER_R8_30]|nr:NHLP bacteriocin export ABC transporter permease/ATPase subunit [Chroococcidiopsidaceae cyanobacterium CP_BM_ER_R8_30]